ncbi:MAG TPA: deaminase [Candidatus Baltobacteraceae bacterium]|nr:deaminase [Candidatus Baltobacteraceae bacterium]
MPKISNELDLALLRQSIEVSRSAPPSMTAFSVGCVIVDANHQVVGTGYSREFGETWHAEAVAIEKARDQSVDLAGCTLYTSLEPCSVRKSGRRPCCDLILEVGIQRVVFASREASIFVEGRGAETLSAAGIELSEIESLAAEVESVNFHLLGGK